MNLQLLKILLTPDIPSLSRWDPKMAKLEGSRLRLGQRRIKYSFIGTQNLRANSVLFVFYSLIRLIYLMTGFPIQSKCGNKKLAV